MLFRSIAGECIIRSYPAEIEIGKLLPGVVAGELAEHFYVGRVPQFSLDLLKTGDYEQAFKYASMEYRSLRTTKRYDIETRQLIDPPNFPDEGEETEVLKLIQKCMVDTYLNLGSRWWPLITAVADELKRRRSLSGTEFYAVIGEYHQRKRRKAA